MNPVDAYAFAGSVLLVLAYYILLGWRMRRDPDFSVHAANNAARRAWVLAVMDDPRKDVMAVQTLRNFIMVGILMVSTATLLIIGTLTLSGPEARMAQDGLCASACGDGAHSLRMLKILLLLADFLVAFFSFALSIRLANQVVFMINVPAVARDDHPALAPERVAARLNRAGRVHAVGMRSLFFAVPLVFWLFGPAFLLASTVGLVLVLERIDRHQGGL